MTVTPFGIPPSKLRSTQRRLPHPEALYSAKFSLLTDMEFVIPRRYPLRLMDNGRWNGSPFPDSPDVEVETKICPANNANGLFPTITWQIFAPWKTGKKVTIKYFYDANAPAVIDNDAIEGSLPVHSSV